MDTTAVITLMLYFYVKHRLKLTICNDFYYGYLPNEGGWTLFKC